MNPLGNDSDDEESHCNDSDDEESGGESSEKDSDFVCVNNDGCCTKRDDLYMKNR